RPYCSGGNALPIESLKTGSSPAGILSAAAPKRRLRQKRGKNRAVRCRAHGLETACPKTRMWSLNQGRANDTGLGGSYDDVDAWSLDVQRIDGDRSASSARRAGLLVDDEADAAWQRDGE